MTPRTLHAPLELVLIAAVAVALGALLTRWWMVPAWCVYLPVAVTTAILEILGVRGLWGGWMATVPMALYIAVTAEALGRITYVLDRYERQLSRIACPFMGLLFVGVFLAAEPTSRYFDGAGVWRAATAVWCAGTLVTALLYTWGPEEPTHGAFVWHTALLAAWFVGNVVDWTAEQPWARWAANDVKLAIHVGCCWGWIRMRWE